MPYFKKLIIYCLIILITVSIIIFLNKENNSKPPKELNYVFPTLENNVLQINKIKLTSLISQNKFGFIQLEKVENYWYVTKFRDKEIFFPADKQVVNDLLDKIINLKKVNSSQSTKTKIKNFRLENPQLNKNNFANTGFKISLFNKEDINLAKLIIGADNVGTDGNFLIDLSNKNQIIIGNIKFNLPSLNNLSLLDRKIVPKFKLKNTNIVELEFKEKTKNTQLFQAHSINGEQFFLRKKQSKNNNQNQTITPKEKELNSIIKDRIISLFEVATVKDIRFYNNKNKLLKNKIYEIKTFVVLQDNIKFIIKMNVYKNLEYKKSRDKSKTKLFISLKAKSISNNIITNKFTSELNQYWKNNLFYLDDVISKYLIELSFKKIYEEASK